MTKEINLKKIEKESKRIEFKGSIDISSPKDIVEIVKDIVAIANSGGGFILFGINDEGKPSGWDPNQFMETDPAFITDKIKRYTGEQFSEFSIFSIKRNKIKIAAIKVEGIFPPLIFVNPGTYPCGNGKQNTAFSRGAIYFRHGAKSEPGETKDLKKVFEKQVEETKKSWLGNIRKVVEAPTGSNIRVVLPITNKAAGQITQPVRIVDDEHAPIYGTIFPDQSHPHRMTDVINEVNKRLGSKIINSHDIKCINTVYNIKSKPNYYYKSKYSAPQYSENYVEWLVDQYIKDQSFYTKARSKYKSGEYTV